MVMVILDIGLESVDDTSLLFRYNQHIFLARLWVSIGCYDYEKDLSNVFIVTWSTIWRQLVFLTRLNLQMFATLQRNW